MTHSEAAIRSALIDKALGQTGWNVKDPTQPIWSQLFKKEAAKRPFAESNFLKAPFFAACEANGVFK
jgi:hypothetical protein